MYKVVFLFIYSITIINSFAQDSIKAKTYDDVIITATRTPTKIKNIAVPIGIINKTQIVQTGALKMNELMQEQTGVFITNGSGSRAVGGGIFGNGLQMQGMSPDHTLILIDGEPVNGRQGGILDLSRIAVGNIKRIEIIKGPYSSLYGSEAMGGVVNILTENPKNNQLEASYRYASFRTQDVQLKLFFQKHKWKNSFFANGFTTNGYDLNKNDIEKTVEPNTNASFQLKNEYAFNSKAKIILNTRLFAANQQSRFAINSNKINIEGAAKTYDLASSLSFQYDISNKLKHSTNLYFNRYTYNQLLDSIDTKNVYYKDDFLQNMLRIENITFLQWHKKVLSIFGNGFTFQNIVTERYANTKSQNAFHLFNQNEIKLNAKTNISAGLRFDYNTAYHYSINPKLAATYQVNNKIKLNASIGSGFKAPDFRQLYLNFINNAADSYIIYGANEFSLEKLQQQLSSGFIAQIYAAASSIKKLEPEQSVGYNVGAQIYPVDNLKVQFNFFRNDVKNLIQYIEIGKRANGASVFSYININKAYTQGVEINAEYDVVKNVQLSGGYQYLNTGDKALVANVKNKTVYGRDAVGAPARIMQWQDYNGLQNRSKHLANFKFVYTFKNIQWSNRLLYRSKWGIVDLDGNGFANMPAEFANSFVQWNSSINYNGLKNTSLQFGVNNISNYKDANNLTNVPGRNYYITINLKLSTKNKN